MLSDFHFLRPYWFMALIPLLALLWYLIKRNKLSRHWEGVCDSALLPYILVGKTGAKGFQQMILTGIAGLLTIIALAGPTWERLPQPVFQKQSALVIALDLSYSMYADDIKPNRLERARFKIADLLDLRKEGQTALLVYAGDAFTVTPLTDDIKTIKSQLTALSPEIMPAPGSNTGIAIKKATDLLKQAGMNHGHILMITDEIDRVYEKHFNDARKAGYQISILGVGTEEGVPVKLANGSFLKDRAGSIIIPTLDQANLRELASSGNGRYALMQIQDDDINRLNNIFSHEQDDTQETETDFKSDQWQEFGPWLVLLLLPLMALAFRRGYLSVMLAMIIFNPEQVQAFEWSDLWLNKNQQAMRALENEQANIAAELFKDDKWKAAAKYRAGDFTDAEELLNNKSDSLSEYNRANAMARQGRYEDAIAAYENVLDKVPDHEDAKYNKELIEKELEKQQQQQQSDSNQNSEQQDSESSEEQQQSNSEEKNSEEQQDSQQSQQDQQQAQESESQATEQQQSAEQHQETKESETEQTEQEQMKNEMAEEESDEQGDETQNNQHAMNELDEEQQATEQWLRRIPDDPAGLLRRKFKYQYQQQRQRQRPTNEKYW